MLRQRLAADQATWSDFQDPTVRKDALRSFERDAMQWYEPG